MLFVYNLFVLIVSEIIKAVALFSPKVKLFVEGRTEVFSRLEEKIASTDKSIWFHAASLGEFEQGLPVMEELKARYPTHKIVVTFFSPSGYEVRKNNTVADVTVYLPMDTQANAKRFVEKINPELVFFIKYEYWPNYLNELRKREVATYLISGIFRKDQAFFKWYGGFYRNALKTFAYFFVQNDSSKQLLQSLGFMNVKTSGDTRFDRVVSILERNNELDFIAQFKDHQPTVVIGSSWPKDEGYLVNYINQYKGTAKFIFAPHNIKTEQIEQLKNSLTKSTILYSEKEYQQLSNFQVMIVDTIGILTKVYSYGDMAYVGGGFGTAGLHNILEPATFGIPIVIGPNYSNFAEAVALVHLGGCLSVDNQQALHDTMDLLLQNEDERYEKGHICSTFVQMNKGATAMIVGHVLNETLK